MCKYCKECKEIGGKIDGAELLIDESTSNSIGRTIASLGVGIYSNESGAWMDAVSYFGTLEIAVGKILVSFCPMCGRDLRKNVKSL